MLMVGFNRRFSPHAMKIKKAIHERNNPIIVHYRVNAGFIPKEHWIYGEEGGGRIIGEGCHFLDLFNYFIGVPHKKIEVFSISPKDTYYYPDDNFVTTITYEDGSVANLIYTAMGGSNLPKEYVEVYSDGKTFIIDDYKALRTFGTGRLLGRSSLLAGGGSKGMGQDKGHLEELKQFAKAIKEGGEWPISLEDMVRATEQSFEIDKLVKK